MVIEITYFIGDGGFKQKFSLRQNGVVLDITTIAGAVLVWHFEDSDGAKTKITWDGIPTGTNNEIAGFDVVKTFFTKEDDYICSIEINDNSVLVEHSQDNFLVHILKPAGP